MTCTTNSSNTHRILTLKQVASWQIPDIPSDGSNIVAGVPSLQRGAVWEPQQIEMLWDSIMRGFPIGSIVISKRIIKQNDKRQKTLANDTESLPPATHHILDGQQRCNAIAWGFVNPWNESLSDDVVLWLDLKPGERILKNSTRKYLLRVTTKAHPWGFRPDDQAGNLTAGSIRTAMDDFTKLHLNKEIWPKELPNKFHEKLISQSVVDNKKVKRPTPRLAMPHDAGFPVPVSLLLDHFDGTRLDLEKLKNAPMMKVITAKAGHIELNESELKHFESGLAMVMQSRLVALQVPDGIEKIVDDIEQIFQRLNMQGTRLDPEELAYSVIKAYWPDIEGVISDLPPNLHHSTEARLVSLGVRVALTESEADKLIPERSVEQIRNIFKDKSANETKSVENINDKAKNLIEPFFKNEYFKKALEWIDTNFLYEKEKHSYGIPKYLRSSLAWRSPDVFAWLMLLAKRYNYEPITDEKLTKKIIGIALTIHWFGVDKADAVNALPKRLNDLSNMAISKLNDSENRKTFIRTPLNLTDIEEALQLDENSTKNQLEKWSGFWQGIVAHNKEGETFSEAVANDRKEKYWLFIEKLHSERELLVYAQRGYIEHNFGDFDPSNKLMWKGHNRPWDYDHILPSNSIGGTGNGTFTFTKICQAWQSSIGNLTAVDFTFNRSSQDTVDAFKKYAEMHDGEFKIFSDKIDAFVMKHEQTNDEECARKFVLAAKERLIAIYSEWYSTLEIGQ